MLETTPVFEYFPDSYESAGRPIMGRRVAGASFLRAIAAHAADPTMAALVDDERDFVPFERLIRSASGGRKGAVCLRRLSRTAMHDRGVVHRADPLLAKAAWRRDALGGASYCLTGVTHTLATRAVFDGVRELMIAPLQAWDAVVCTSVAVQRTVQAMMNAWGEYFASHCGGRPKVSFQLPVIPLGVDAEGFDTEGEPYRAARRRCRERLGAGDEDFVLLSAGRQSHATKSHPAPLFRAAELAAGRLAPSVRLHLLNGGDAEQWQGGWAAADAFVALIDNLQESFGLTVVEATALGLPVVAADWSGFRDTVAHGETGFRVPIRLVADGGGDELWRRYGAREIDAEYFLGAMSRRAVIDVPEAALRLATLAEQPALRAQMGAAGRRRVRENYDWPVVLKQYDALWMELNARRLRAGGDDATRGTKVSQRSLDPARLFGSFAPETFPLRAPLSLAADRQLAEDVLKLRVMYLRDERSASPRDAVRRRPARAPLRRPSGPPGIRIA